MRFSNFKSRGFSLVELMVGLAIGLAVMAVAGYVYVLNARSSNVNLKAATLEQEVNAALEIMTSEIRRAGYWDVDDTDVPEPYDHLRIVDFDGNARSCILFFYDENRDGVADDAEFRGFRRNGTGIQTRTSCAGVAAWPGSTARVTDCSICTWQALTDDGLVNVSNLEFSTTGSKCLNLGDTAAASGTRTLDYWEVTSTTSGDFSCPCAAGTSGISYFTYTSGGTPPYPSTGASGCGEVPLTNDSVISARQVNISMQANVADDSSLSKSAATSLRVGNNLFCKVGVSCP